MLNWVVEAIASINLKITGAGSVVIILIILSGVKVASHGLLKIVWPYLSGWTEWKNVYRWDAEPLPSGNQLRDQQAQFRFGWHPWVSGLIMLATPRGLCLKRAGWVTSPAAILLPWQFFEAQALEAGRWLPGKMKLRFKDAQGRKMMVILSSHHLASICSASGGTKFLSSQSNETRLPHGN